MSVKSQERKAVASKYLDVSLMCVCFVSISDFTIFIKETPNSHLKIKNHRVYLAQFHDEIEEVKRKQICIEFRRKSQRRGCSFFASFILMGHVASLYLPQQAFAEAVVELDRMKSATRLTMGSNGPCDPILLSSKIN